MTKDLVAVLVGGAVGSGVRYLVADHVQGRATPALSGLGRVAFANRAVTVYDVGGT